jgi:signal peptidase I
MNIDRTESGLTLTILSKLLIAIAGLLVGLIVTRFIITSYTVYGNSMAPNFIQGDKIYIIKIGSVNTGDVVLVKNPQEPDRTILKRIAAREGDTVEIRDKIIYINDKQIKFQWKTSSNDARILPMSFTYRDNHPIIKLKRKEVYLLGDNLDYGHDSRSFGPVSEDTIIGKLLYKFN